MTHGALAGLLVTLVSAGIAPAQGQSAVSVTGNLTILDKGGKRATDVAEAVVWLEGADQAAARAIRAEINTHSKQFLPRVLVVPAGSSVAFPNHDPFDHNVFSQSEAATFDLGLYGRGETRTAQFASPGIVRVYCNVHAAMSAYVLVQRGSHFTQPGADGSFTLAGVAPGSYSIHAWHERGGHQILELVVEPRMSAVTMRLDASRWKRPKHLNKFGKPYAAEGRRY